MIPFIKKDTPEDDQAAEVTNVVEVNGDNTLVNDDHVDGAVASEETVVEVDEGDSATDEIAASAESSEAEDDDTPDVIVTLGEWGLSPDMFESVHAVDSPDPVREVGAIIGDNARGYVIDLSKNKKYDFSDLGIHTTIGKADNHPGFDATLIDAPTLISEVSGWEDSGVIVIVGLDDIVRWLPEDYGDVDEIAKQILIDRVTETVYDNDLSRVKIVLVSAR